MTTKRGCMFVKISNALISLSLSCVVLSFPVQTTTAENIGLIAPLTGALQQHGEAILFGLREGLRDGKCDSEYQLIIEDDGFDPKRTVSAFKKLVTQDNLKLLFTVGSGPTRAISQLAYEQKLPILTLAGDASVTKGNPLMVRLRKPGREEGHEVGDLAKKHKASKVALLCSQTEFTLSVCDGIQERFDALELTRLEVAPDSTDFRSEILKIRKIDPTHIIPIMAIGKLGLFARQVREAKLQQPFVGGVFFESSSDLESSNGALHGAVYTMPEVSREFSERYHSDKSLAVGSIAWGAIFFDVGRILCSAARNNRTPMAEVEKLSGYQGVVGTITFRTTGEDRYLDSPYLEKLIP